LKNVYCDHCKETVKARVKDVWIDALGNLCYELECVQCDFLMVKENSIFLEREKARI